MLGSTPCVLQVTYSIINIVAMPPTNSAITIVQGRTAFLFVLALQYSCQNASARLVSDSDSNIVDVDQVKVNAQLMTAYVRKQYLIGTKETTQQIMTTMADKAVGLLDGFRNQGMPESFDKSKFASQEEKDYHDLTEVTTSLFQAYQDIGNAFFGPNVYTDWRSRWSSGNLNYTCTRGVYIFQCRNTVDETTAVLRDFKEVHDLVNYRCKDGRSEFYTLDTKGKLADDSAPSKFPAFGSFMTNICPSGPDESFGPDPKMKMSQLAGHFQTVNLALKVEKAKMKKNQAQTLADLNLTSACSKWTGTTCMFQECHAEQAAVCSVGKCNCQRGCSVNGYCRTEEEIARLYKEGLIDKGDLSIGSAVANSVVDSLAAGATDMLNDLRKNPMVLKALQQLVSSVEEKVCTRVKFMPVDTIGELKQQLLTYISPQVQNSVANIEEYLSQGMEFLFTPIRLLPYLGSALSPLLSAIVTWAKDYAKSRLTAYVMESLEKVFEAFIKVLPKQITDMIKLTDQVSNQIKGVFNCKEHESTSSVLELDDATMSAIMNGLEVDADYY